MLLACSTSTDLCRLTLDMGHMLLAGENPAQSVALVAAAGKLFGLQASCYAVLHVLLLLLLLCIVAQPPDLPHQVHVQTSDLASPTARRPPLCS